LPVRRRIQRQRMPTGNGLQGKFPVSSFHHRPTETN
jgi:hypothetical protein